MRVLSCLLVCGMFCVCWTPIQFNQLKSCMPAGTVNPAKYAEANAFFLKAGLLSRPIKTEASLDASVWK